MKICIKSGCGYTDKHGPINDPALVYCPACSNKLADVQSNGPIQASDAARGARILAGFIDLIIAMIFVSIGMIPGINVLGAIISTLFWLLRDIKGASPGKSIMGLEVRTRGGVKPSTVSLMLRNLPFTPLIVQVIPIVGNIILPIEGFIVIGEFLLVLIFNRRLGDFLAGTKVMRKQAVPLRAAAAGTSY
jgi:uncharacterized RDD family membrane protein YckC